MEDTLEGVLRDLSVDLPRPAFTREVRDAMAHGHDARPSRRRVATTIVGLSAVVAIAAILALVASAADPTGNGDAAVAPSGTTVSSATPAAPTVPVRFWELHVQRPAEWADAVHGTRQDWPGEPVYMVGSMGTVPVEQTCEPLALGAEHTAHESWSCRTAWDPSAEIQVRFEHVADVDEENDEVAVDSWGQWAMVSEPPPLGARRITIDGVGAQVRAAFGERVPQTGELVGGVARIIVWDLPTPENLWTSFRITAVIRGEAARADELERQVRGVVGGITYVPPFTWDLPADDPAGALRAGLGALRELAARSPTTDAACFPDNPGGRREARIAQAAFLGYELTQPLDVICSSAIEPTEFRRWKMTLRYDWPATDQYDAGHAELVVLIDVTHGVVGYGGDAFGLDEMPFLRRIPGIEEG